MVATLCSAALLSGVKSFTADLPKSTDQFVDSVGINTHLFHQGTPYMEFEKVTRPLLVGLGVRHIRDEMATDNAQGCWGRLRQLGKDGIKCDIIITPSWHTVDLALKVTQTELAQCQEMVEGPNEWDLRVKGWQPELNTCTTEIWSKYKAAFPKMPVVGGTVVKPENVASYVSQFGSMAKEIDYGNCHPYVYWAPSPESTLNGLINKTWAPLWGPRPFLVTETGYHTGTSPDSVSDVVQGKMIPRTLFYLLNQGVKRTYLYELIDETGDPANSESNYGIVANSGAPKPAYRAVKALLGLLKEPAATGGPKPLTWSASGDTEGFQRTLLCNREGYWLAVWTASNASELPVSRSVEFHLPKRVSTVTQYRLSPEGSMSSERIRKVKGTFKATISDSISILRFR